MRILPCWHFAGWKPNKRGCSCCPCLYTPDLLNIRPNTIGNISLMQTLREALKARSQPTAALHLPSALANRHLSLMSYERSDSTTSQALLDLSVWSEAQLSQPGRYFSPGKLSLIGEAGIMKSLLVLGQQNEKAQSRSECQSCAVAIVLKNICSTCSITFSCPVAYQLQTFRQKVVKIRIKEINVIFQTYMIQVVLQHNLHQ